MPPHQSFDELIRQVSVGDHEAAARLVWGFEPVIRRVVRARLRNARTCREFDSMDICQSVLANFFVRVAAGQYDLKEPDKGHGIVVLLAQLRFAQLKGGARYGESIMCSHVIQTRGNDGRIGPRAKANGSTPDKAIVDSAAMVSSL